MSPSDTIVKIMFFMIKDRRLYVAAGARLGKFQLQILPFRISKDLTVLTLHIKTTIRSFSINMTNLGRI